MKMVFTASCPQSYACGPYQIHWGVKGWTVWNYAKRMACLGRDLTISEALAAAQKDKDKAALS